MERRAFSESNETSSQPIDLPAFFCDRTCEITLELMRRYADTLITIIEVFLYDPLYQWQLSPQKALQLQQQLDKMNNDTVLSGSRRMSGKPATVSSSSSSAVVQFNGTSESTAQTGPSSDSRLINQLTFPSPFRYE